MNMTPQRIAKQGYRKGFITQRTQAYDRLPVLTEAQVLAVGGKFAEALGHEGKARDSFVAMFAWGYSDASREV